MFCPNTQKYKINYSEYHGICADHDINIPSVPICSMCGSKVPALFKNIEKYNCKYCNQETDQKPHDCGNSICSNCMEYAHKCPTCNSEEILFYKDTPERNTKKDTKKELMLSMENFNQENSNQYNDLKKNYNLQLARQNTKIDKGEEVLKDDNVENHILFANLFYQEPIEQVYIDELGNNSSVEQPKISTFLIEGCCAKLKKSCLEVCSLLGNCLRCVGACIASCCTSCFGSCCAKRKKN